MEEKALNMAGITRDEIPPHATDDELLALARCAMECSYSPYSHYPVGASLLAQDGRVFTGCNVENASFGLTNCAERTALSKPSAKARAALTPSLSLPRIPRPIPAALVGKR